MIKFPLFVIENNSAHRAGTMLVFNMHRGDFLKFGHICYYGISRKIKVRII